MNEKSNVISQESGQIEEGLIRLDRMYESLRYNEYSMESGLGEIVDNSVEARAANIYVDVKVGKVVKEGNKKPSDKIIEIAVIDDGMGMDFDVLRKCLVLGESLRVSKDGRRGIGRFGVGMTMGSISLARRIEVYSRAKPIGDFLYTYIDLDKIGNKSLVKIPLPVPKQPDIRHRNILADSSGTIVILSHCDRIGGTDKELANYLGRTYRKFIEAGLNIELNSKKVYLHDPLYMSGPTMFDIEAMKTGGMDPKAEPWGEERIPLEVPGGDGQTEDVVIRMSLLPKEWRLEKGAGDSLEARLRKVPDNEGISIIRANREVLYGSVPYIIGRRGEAKSLDIDRWWGCEISFPPELDDYFQVRYIKRGAEPVESLRVKIQGTITEAVKNARNRVRLDWSHQCTEESVAAGDFGEAEQIMAAVEAIMPRSKKGQNLTKDEADKKLDDVLDSLGDAVKNEDARKEKKKELGEKPYSIEWVHYPESFLFETEHILGKIIIKLNLNHPFCKHVLLPLCGPLDAKYDEDDITIKAGKNEIKNAILLLLFGYAKAEALMPDVDDMLLAQLRCQWGIALSAAIKQQYEKEDRK